MWLIENNTLAHTCAARQCEEDRRLHNIQKYEWPPNSPDLQDLWGPEKSLIRPKLLEIKEA